MKVNFTNIKPCQINVTLLYPLKICSGSSIELYIGLNWVKRFYGKNLLKSSAKWAIKFSFTILLKKHDIKTNSNCFQTLLKTSRWLFRSCSCGRELASGTAHVEVSWFPLPSPRIYKILMKLKSVHIWRGPSCLAKILVDFN